jgi:hypothetical protein
MTRRAFGIGVTAGAVSTPLKSEERPDETFGNLNGRSWKAMGQTSRMNFILGYKNGIDGMDEMTTTVLKNAGVSATTTGLVEKLRNALLPSRMTVGELIAALTNSYDEPTNLFIPISAMMSVVTLKSEGASTAEIDKRLDECRAYYSNPDNYKVPAK